MEMTFAAFMRQVDTYLDNWSGLTHLDLEDYRYRDCYDDEMTPKETAREALEYAGYPMEELPE